MSNPTDFTTIMKDPARVFSSPRQVVETRDFSNDEKIQILQAWDFDAREIDESGPEVLKEIRTALHEVTDRGEGRSH
jgi:hypothetical protein